MTDQEFDLLNLFPRASADIQIITLEESRWSLADELVRRKWLRKGDASGEYRMAILGNAMRIMKTIKRRGG